MVTGKQKPTVGEVFDILIIIFAILGLIGCYVGLLFIGRHIIWSKSTDTYKVVYLNWKTIYKVLISIAMVGFGIGSLVVCIKSCQEFRDGGIVADGYCVFLCIMLLIFCAGFPGFFGIIFIILDACGVADMGGGYKTPKVKPAKSYSNSTPTTSISSHRDRLTGPVKDEIEQQDQEEEEQEEVQDTDSWSGKGFDTFRKEVLKLRSKRK